MLSPGERSVALETTSAGGLALSLGERSVALETTSARGACFLFIGEDMDDNKLILTESEKLEFMIKVTFYCSELSGIPVRYVARMFVDNDVYPYLCRSANLWITKT